MDDKNRKLLEEVATNRLEKALKSDDDSEQAFKEAITAVEKLTELSKVDVSLKEHVDKLENEKEARVHEEAFKKDEAIKNRNVQLAIFAAGLIATPIIEVITKSIYANKICKLEQFETFTTTAGRGLSSLFRFKS